MPCLIRSLSLFRRKRVFIDNLEFVGFWRVRRRADGTLAAAALTLLEDVVKDSLEEKVDLAWRGKAVARHRDKDLRRVFRGGPRTGALDVE